MAKKFILSIDGGGVRGVVPLTILKHIEAFTSKPIWSTFVLIAGTSTGGLVACGISSGYTTQQLVDIYISRCPDIFPPQNGIKKIIDEVGNLAEPKYSDLGIHKVFEDVLKDKKIYDLKTNILIPAHDTISDSTIWFDNSIVSNVLLYNICRATSAAPTYLPAYKWGNQMYIDGGVACNNPSMAAYIKTKNEYPEDDIYMLSLGTGSYKQPLKDCQFKGEAYYAPRIPDVILQAYNDAEVKKCADLLGNRFMRLDIKIDTQKASEIDNAATDNLKHLIQLTEQQLNIATLKSFLSN